MPKELVNAITSKLKYRNTSVDVGKRNGKHEQSKMYENNNENIEKAKDGSEEAMTELIENNKRTYLEHSKKMFIKRN